MEILVRYGKPNAFDQAPQGTTCKVALEGEKFELFIQVSTDTTHPVWESLGEFYTTLDENSLKTIIQQRLPKN